MKTKLVTFISAMVLLSFLLTSVIVASVLMRMYNEELYRQAETNTSQILQTVDMTVPALESSLIQLFSNSGMRETLGRTDFTVYDSSMYRAYIKLDASISQFRHAYPRLISLLFADLNNGVYRYNFLSSRFDFSSCYFPGDDVPSVYSANRLFFDGIVRIPVVDDRGTRMVDAYAISFFIFDTAQFSWVGKTTAFFGEDVLSSIYEDIARDTGGKVLLLDSANRTVSPRGPENAALPEGVFARWRDGKPWSGQFVSADGKSLVTYARSAATHWTVVLETPLTTHERRLLVMVAMVSLSCLTILGVAFFIINRYVGLFTKDIVAVTKAMEKVGNSDLDARLTSRRDDEIGLIISGFNAMAEKLNALFRKAVEEEKSKKDAQIMSLYYQINPHFLYNTLASIRLHAMSRGDGEIAEMIAVLNRFLRNTISVKERYIPIEKEIANLQDYAAIYNIRYRGKINIRFLADDDILSLRIPAMIVQPVVENAIHHGYDADINGGTLTIEVTFAVAGGDIVITVEDNGVGMTPSAVNGLLGGTDRERGEGHIGIRNIHERLEGMFGEGYGVSAESEPGVYTRVTLRVGREE